MAKQVFGSATDIFYFDSTSYDVTGLSMDAEAAEVDMTDTSTAAGTTEADAGRVSSTFTVNIIKDTAAADIALGSAVAGGILNFGAKTYSGTFILFTKNTTGELGSRIEQTYTGRINGTVT